MIVKRLAWLALAVVFLMNGGCCRFWDHWCHGHGHNYGPQPYYPPQCCPAPAPPHCPTYSSPAGAIPVPNAVPRTSWQGDCK